MVLYLPPIKTLESIETSKYLLDIFLCEKGKMIVVIDENCRCGICEPFEDGLGLREIYDEWRREDVNEEKIDNFLDNYFKTNRSSCSKVLSESY